VVNEWSGVRTRVRAYGRRIAPTMLQPGGITGHWGLSAMRERSEGIGSHLKIASRLGVGTEVELKVPAALAYRLMDLAGWPPASGKRRGCRRSLCGRCTWLCTSSASLKCSREQAEVRGWGSTLRVRNVWGGRGNRPVLAGRGLVHFRFRCRLPCRRTCHRHIVPL
jgi:hypothetical protein